MFAPTLSAHRRRLFSALLGIYLAGSSAGIGAQSPATTEPATASPATTTEPPTTEPDKTEPKATEPATPPAAASGGDDELLAALIPADQVWWLAAGEDKFLGLYIAEETGRDSYGATLILPDPGRPADWPVLTRTLRELLPKHGWHTLAINPSTDAAQLQARIEAAIKQLRSKNISNIALIAEGKTALGALQYLQTHAGQIRAIAMLNPDHHGLVMLPKKPAAADDEKTSTAPAEEKTAAGRQDLLIESIAMLAVPCLDLATGSDSDDRQRAAQRLAASRRLPAGQYQQIALPDNDSPATNPQENPLSKRVRGWLLKNALPPKPAEPAQ